MITACRHAKADAQAEPEVEPEAEHRIVMRDAAFDPISAIPTREHMKTRGAIILSPTIPSAMDGAAQHHSPGGGGTRPAD
jgi:hypothetical protein